MGQYRAKDLLLIPGLLSLARIPLAGLFFVLVERPGWAFAMLLLAGLTDIADGWWARRYGQVTATGTVVDPITDKLFVGTVVAALLLHQQLSLIHLALLSTREIGELPLVVWLGVSRDARRRRREQPSANIVGKIATAAQFAAVTAALFQSASRDILVYTTGLIGVVAAISYWRRELQRGRGGAG